MADILVVKCRTNIPCEQLKHILDCLKAQTYLKAQVVPDDIEIKFIDEKENKDNVHKT